MKLSKTQEDALSCLDRTGGRLGGFRQATIDALLRLKLIEGYVPEATTYSMAARGRPRYYRLTEEGERRQMTPSDPGPPPVQLPTRPQDHPS